MAKKKDAAVGELIQTLPSGVQGQIALTVEDLNKFGLGEKVVRVGVEARREQLHAATVKADEAIKESEKRIDKLQKVANAAMIAEASKKLKSTMETAKPFFESLQYRDVETTVTAPTSSKTVDSEFKLFHVTFRVEGSGRLNDRQEIQTTPLTYKTVKNIREALQAVEDAKEEYEKRRESAMSLRRACQDHEIEKYRNSLLVKMDRQAIAAAGGDGDRLLEMVEKWVAEDIKSLSPGNPG